jgi:hypothetical protein
MLPASVIAFAAVVGFADLAGWGHGYMGILALTGLFFAIRAAPPAWQMHALRLWLIPSFFIAFAAIWQTMLGQRATGGFASANFLGSYAALNIFIMLRLWEQEPKVWLSFAFWLNIIALFGSESRGAILAASLGGAIMVRRDIWPAALIFFGGIVVIALIGINRPDALADPRWHIWRIGLDLWMQRPVTGWGQSGVMVANLGHFYSISIEWLVNAGAMGLIAGAVMIGGAAWQGRQDTALLAFLAVWFVQGLFIFSLPITAIPLYMMMAVASIHRNPALRPVIVVNDEPLLYRRVGPGWAK